MDHVITFTVTAGRRIRQAAGMRSSGERASERASNRSTATDFRLCPTMACYGENRAPRHSPWRHASPRHQQPARPRRWARPARQPPGAPHWREPHSMHGGSGAARGPPGASGTTGRSSRSPGWRVRGARGSAETFRLGRGGESDRRGEARRGNAGKGGWWFSCPCSNVLTRHPPTHSLTHSPVCLRAKLCGHGTDSCPR